MFFQKLNEVQLYERRKLNYHNVNDSYIPRKSRDYNSIIIEFRKIANFKLKIKDRQYPTYEDLTYSFSTLWWCKSSMHSAETILQILNFDPVLG